MFSKELRLHAEAHFKSRIPELQYEFVDYPGKPVRRYPIRVA